MQPSRSATVFFALTISLALLLLSLMGVLGGAEGVAKIPLIFLQDVLGGASKDMRAFSEELAEVRQLRERNIELERALTQYQSELAELRAFRSDYTRLAKLANYVGQAGEEWRYVSADVIGRDLTGVIHLIHINAGTRHGVEVGDPAVSELGLVGRVAKVSATGAEVLLISDLNSAVNALILNEKREAGLLRGSLSGELVLDFLDINADVQEGQQAYTSGLTQGFPPNILLGQIEGVRLSDDTLFQQASVRSLVDFDALQMVLVITNWEAVDLEIFEQATDEEAAP